MSLILAGRLFHNVGAATMNDRSPSVFFDLPRGYDNKRPLLDHRRPNLRMNYQVLRVFNGFYKQIYSQPKLF